MPRARFALGLMSLVLPTITPLGGCASRTIDDVDPAPLTQRGGVEKRNPLTGPEAVPVKYDGILSGVITLDGPMPEFMMLADMSAKPECHAPDMMPDKIQNTNQTWIVDPKGKGVANVAIWLVPPQGTYFDMPEELRTRSNKVQLRQPYCAFVPHVVSAFPRYWNGKEYKTTGQKFEILNDAKITHNSKWGGDARKNPGGNPVLSPGEPAILDLAPEDHIQVQCNIHPWMGAHVFTFEHPFHAVTGPDGTFEIKNVPTGVPLRVMVWHEGAGNILGADGTEMTFQPGDAKKLELKAKREAK